MPTQTDPEPTEPQNDPEPTDAEQEKFWKRFGEETAKVVDARLAERDKKRKEKSDDKRRSDSKRTTVPGMIADLMFGKER